MDLLCLRVLGGRYRHPDFCLYHVLGAARLYRHRSGGLLQLYVGALRGPLWHHVAACRLRSGDCRCARHGCAPGRGHGRVSGRDRQQARAQTHQPRRRPAGGHSLHHLRFLWHDHHPSVYRATDRRSWFWCANGVVRACHHDRPYHHHAHYRRSQFHSHGHSRGIVCHGRHQVADHL